MLSQNIFSVQLFLFKVEFKSLKNVPIRWANYVVRVRFQVPCCLRAWLTKGGAAGAGNVSPFPRARVDS